MSVIYDRDPGDETDAPDPSPSTGMCEICAENEALPDYDLCGGCLLDLELAFKEVLDGEGK